METRILIKGYETTLFDKELKQVFEAFYPISKMGSKDMIKHLELNENLTICERKWITKEFKINDDMLDDIISYNEDVAGLE